MDKPWLMFEAGALSKSMKASRVCPVVYAMDLVEMSGPIAQFQANRLDEQGIFQVLKAINAATPENGLDSEHLKEQFDMMWPRLEQIIMAIPPYATPTQPIPPKLSFASADDVVKFLHTVNIRGTKLFPEPPTSPPRTLREQSSEYHKRSVVYAPVSTMEGAIWAVTAQWDHQFEEQDEADLAFTLLISAVSSDLGAWSLAGLPVPTIALNLADKKEISQEHRDALVAMGKAYPDCVEIGFSEDFLMGDFQNVRSFADELRAAGLRLGVRRFGVGYSSLSYLQRLPLQTLWVAEELIRNISPDLLGVTDATIVAAIASLANQLHLTVVAEGVSNAEQSKALLEVGIKNIAGTMAGDFMSRQDLYRRISI